MKGLSVTTPPLKELFPIGSIYINVNTTNPGTIFGGTWEQIKDTFLLCSGSTYSNGSTGGSASHVHETQGHTLTIAEMPSHNHKPNNYNTAGSESGYERHFTTNLSTSSDSVGRRTVGGSGSGYAMTGTVSDDINGASATANTGNSQSHSHGDTTSTSSLPPYLAVTVWKRIA